MGLKSRLGGRSVWIYFSVSSDIWTAQLHESLPTAATRQGSALHFFLSLEMQLSRFRATPALHRAVTTRPQTAPISAHFFTPFHLSGIFPHFCTQIFPSPLIPGTLSSSGTAAILGKISSVGINHHQTVFISEGSLRALGLLQKAMQPPHLWQLVGTTGLIQGSHRQCQESPLQNHTWIHPGLSNMATGRK